MRDRDQTDYFKGISYSIVYDNYSNTQDSIICNIISKNIIEGKISSKIVEVTNDSKLSMYAHLPFEFVGFALLELKESLGYLGFKDEVYKYNSIYQYVTHQKAILFLDVKNESNILRSNGKEQLMYLDKSISNYDESIWREYALRILINGIKALTQQSTQFSKNLKEEEGVFYSISSDPFWSVESTRIGIDEILIPKRKKNMNVFGKILTLCNIDEI